MSEGREPTSDDASGVQVPTAENTAPRKESNLAVWSYVSYNFGNTPFAATVMTLYFPLWLTEQYGAGADLFNYVTALAFLLVVLIAPALGALADLRQRRIPYLVVLTLVTVFLTVGLDFTDDLTGSLLVAVIFFVVAAVAYQLTYVPYNALLASVSAGRGTGRVSGYAQAGGFIGTFLALIGLTLFVAPESFLGFTIGGPEEIRRVFGPLGGWVQTTAAQVDSNTFLPTAIIFLLFALPAFFFVSDVAVHAPQPARLGRAYRSIFATLRGMGAYAGLGAYMCVTLLFIGATNIAVPNMSLFGKQIFGMEDQLITHLIIFSLIFSVLGAFGAGYVSDKVGPKRTLLATLGLWIIGIMAVTLAWAPWVLFIAGPLIFLAMGATFALGPVLLIALSPREKLTEFMGFYTMVVNVSGVVAPAIVALLLGVFGGLGTGVSYRIAMSSLAVAMVLGIFILLRVPDARTPEAHT
jgi:UMF1 family MFS transporter